MLFNLHNACKKVIITAAEEENPPICNSPSNTTDILTLKGYLLFKAIVALLK